MKKKTATVLKWISGVIALIGIVYSGFTWHANRELSRVYAALEADGRPLTAAEITPPAIPDQDNAALVYEAVVLQLKSESSGEEDLFSLLNDLAKTIMGKTESKEDAVQTFIQLSKNDVFADALARLHAGSRKSGCSFDLDYSKGAELLLPHISELRSLSNLLCVTARMQADAGDKTAAWETILTSLRLANALKDEPLLISQLVRMAMFDSSANAIQALAQKTLPSEPQSREIEELLLNFEDIDPFLLGMDGERLLFGEWAFNFTQNDLLEQLTGDSSLMGRAYASMLINLPLRKYDQATYLKVMHTSTQHALAPYSPDNASLVEDMLMDAGPFAILTSLLAPATSQAHARHVSMIAKARITRAGLNVLRQREKADSFPETLEPLDDPFVQKPLIYKTSSKGFIIYSVGKNLNDDDGSASEDRDDNDIVWRYTTD